MRGVDFRSISVEKIMFSLESGWGGRFLVDFSIFGFRVKISNAVSVFRLFVRLFVRSVSRFFVFEVSFVSSCN